MKKNHRKEKIKKSSRKLLKLFESFNSIEWDREKETTTFILNCDKKKLFYDIYFLYFLWLCIKN